MTCRSCRALLPGYIQRELTPKQRERVSRHLNTCVECYAAYEAQRELVRELTLNVPRIGSDHPPLDRIRAAVMAEIAQPKARRSSLYQARYSVVALMLVVALLLPWTFHSYAAPQPTQPRPESMTPQGTAVIVDLPTAVPNTLTATLQSNYAPVSGATDAP